MVIAVVSELVVGGGQSLKALSCNRREVSGELGVLGQDHYASGHEAVYERFLTHWPQLSHLGTGTERQTRRASWLANLVSLLGSKNLLLGFIKKHYD